MIYVLFLYAPTLRSNPFLPIVVRAMIIRPAAARANMVAVSMFPETLQSMKEIEITNCGITLSYGMAE